MYYVIQQIHENKLKHFVNYKVPKYIAASNNENVIFEFIINGQKKRKWAAKKDIIILTDNFELYQKTLLKLKALQDENLQKVENAQAQLDDTILQLSKKCNKELNKLKEDDSLSLL